MIDCGHYFLLCSAVMLLATNHYFFLVRYCMYVAFSPCCLQAVRTHALIARFSPNVYLYIVSLITLLSLVDLQACHHFQGHNSTVKMTVISMHPSRSHQSFFIVLRGSSCADVSYPGRFERPAATKPSNEGAEAQPMAAHNFTFSGSSCFTRY